MLWTILIGLIVGLLAKFFMPGRDPGGFIAAILGAMLLLFIYRAVTGRNNRLPA